MPFQSNPLPTSVPTVADLATAYARTVEGGVVFTSGRDTAGDGGAAAYIYHRTGGTGVTLDGGGRVAGLGSEEYWVLADSDRVRVSVYDVDRTGTVDARTSIAAAQAFLDGDGELIFPRGVYRISSNLTFTRRVVFELGAIIKPDSGVLVSFVLGYDARDMQRCFDLSSGGTVASVDEYVTFPHFGIDTTGATDAHAIAQAVATAHQQITTKLVLPENCTMKLSDTLSITGSGNHLHIEGRGDTSVIYSEDPNIAINFSFNSDYAYLKRFKLLGNHQMGTGIYCRINAGTIVIDDVTVQDFGNVGASAETTTSHAGIYCEDCLDVTIKNVRVSGGADHEWSLDDDIRVLNTLKFRIKDCSCTSANSAGVAVSHTTTGQLFGVINGIISQNHRRHGILAAYVADYIRVTITGCNIHNCGWTGIYSIDNGTVPEGTSKIGKVSISGNVITHSGGNYAADQAGNAGIHISGKRGTSITGNTITDCGYDPDGTLQTNYGRGIYLVDVANVTATGNTIEHCSRSGIETSANQDIDGVVLSSNIITDCAEQCIGLSNGGTTNQHTGILITANVMRQFASDGHGINIYDETGSKIVIRGNTIEGNKAGTDKAAIWFRRERSWSTDIFDNNFVNWDIGIQADYDTGTEEDWMLGIQCRMDENTFDKVATCFQTRPVYCALGRSNVFRNCVPGFSQLKVPARFENGVLNGYYVGALPAIKCRSGDRLQALVPGPQKNLSFLNIAATPAAKAISNSSSSANTLTITSHGYSVGDRLRVTGSDLPSPLYVNQEVYVFSVSDANTIQVCEFTNALYEINITEDSGTGSAQILEATPTWVPFPNIDDGSPATVYEDLSLSAVNRWMGDANGDTTGDPDDQQGSDDLTWSGTPAYGTPPIGSEGKSFVLNGSSTWLASGTGVADYADNFSVFIWVKFSAFDSGDTFIAKMYDGGTLERSWRLALDGGGYLVFVDTAGTIFQASSILDVDTWYHVGFVVENGSAKMYIDGAQSGADFAPAITVYTNSPVYVGGLGYLPNFLITGEVFDARVYDSALTSADVALIVAGPLVVNPNGELSYFNLTGTSVTIAGVSDGTTNMVKAAPTSSVEASIKFDNGGADNGRLRYTYSARKSCDVQCNVSLSCTTGKLLVVGISKNGTVDAASKVLVTSTGSVVSINLALQADLVTNDYLEVFIGNTTDTTAVTVHALQLKAV